MRYKEKLRALIERRRKDWRYGNSVEAKYKAEECDDILELIDSMQEEPVSKVWHEPIERPDSNNVVLIIVRCGYIGEPGIPHLAKYDSHNNQYIDIDWTDVCNCPIVHHVDSVEKWVYIDDVLNLSNVERTEKNWKEESVSGNIDFEQELYKAFGQVKDFTLGMQIAKRFYDMGKNSKDSQEPVSEDLEKAAEQDVCEVVNCCSATGIPNDHIQSWVQDAMINEFIHGAQWQLNKISKKYEENRD